MQADIPTMFTVWPSPIRRINKGIKSEDMIAPKFIAMKFMIWVDVGPKYRFSLKNIACYFIVNDSSESKSLCANTK